jgi:beta-glucosidase
VLPIDRGARVYAPDLDQAVLAGYAVPVSSPTEADVAVVRLRAPYEPRNTYFLDAMFHAGSLDFDADALSRVTELARVVPVVVDLYLDRPAILGSLVDAAAAIVVNYGCAEPALLDVIFGAAEPQGRLPFELPRSMAAVQASRPDLPSDTEDPLFPYRFGLSYRSETRE